MFPADPGALAFPRHPDAVTKQFMARAAKLGFPGLRFHDLRGTHLTLLWIAACRCIRSPRVRTRSGRPVAYLAKRIKKSDQNAADQDDPLTLFWRQLLVRSCVEYA